MNLLKTLIIKILVKFKYFTISFKEMMFDKVLKNRRSVKEFKHKIISEGDISEIVNSGQYAPSSGNIQNWEFLVIKDVDKIEEVSKLCKRGRWISKSDFLVLILNDRQEVKKHFSKIGEKWSIQNCACAAYNMLLKATDLKIGSCWVGDYDEKKLKELLVIPDKLDVDAVLVFGHSNEEKQFSRDDIRSKVHYNLYNKKNKDIFPLESNVKLKKKKKKGKSIITSFFPKKSQR